MLRCPHRVCLLGDTSIIIKSQNQVWLAKHKATQTLCFSLHKAALDCVFSPTNPLPLTAKTHLKREKREREEKDGTTVSGPVKWPGLSMEISYPLVLLSCKRRPSSCPTDTTCLYTPKCCYPSSKERCMFCLLLQTVGSFWRTTLTILLYERCAGNLTVSNFKHKQTWLPQV